MTIVYQEFTAQAFNVGALLKLYADLEKNNDKKPNLIPIVVFIAFSIEAYVNSLGYRQIEFWSEIERLPWKKKIEILHKIANKKADWGKEPLQFVSEVFAIRDKLAHGKPERVETDNEHAPVYYEELKPDWYKKITKEWVLDARERFDNVMTYLSDLFGYHESDHLHISSGGEVDHEGA